MDELGVDAWKDRTTARQRVQTVVLSLDEAMPVSYIQEKAHVAWDTAKKELEQLETQGRVASQKGPEGTRYRAHSVQLLLDEIRVLIDEYTKEELEAELFKCRGEIESFEEDYSVESASELRTQVAAEDISIDEMKEIRNAALTWEALETDCRLIQHALHLYDDATQSSSGGDGNLLVAD